LCYAVCIAQSRSGETTSSGTATAKLSFPYIPGYRYWREGAILESAIKETGRFDVLIVHGHGIAHPRRAGLASSVGLRIGKPTIGVARRLLVGELGRENEGKTPILINRSPVGVRLSGLPPLFVSVGHMISMSSAISVVRDTWRGTGLPLPLAAAHDSARRIRYKDFNRRDPGSVRGFS